MNPRVAYPRAARENVETPRPHSRIGRSDLVANTHERAGPLLAIHSCAAGGDRRRSTLARDLSRGGQVVGVVTHLLEVPGAEAMVPQAPAGDL